MMLLIVFVSLLLTNTIVAATHDVTVYLKFGSEELNLTFPGTEADARHMAHKFCSDKGMERGEQFDSCLEAVSDYLVLEVRKAHFENFNEDATVNEEKFEVLTVTLQVGSNQYNIEYKHATESAHSVATAFCTKNRKALGVTKYTLRTCVDPVESELQTALIRHLADKKSDSVTSKAGTTQNKPKKRTPKVLFYFVDVQ